jgi:hypothetical protein
MACDDRLLNYAHQARTTSGCASELLDSFAVTLLKQPILSLAFIPFRKSAQKIRAFIIACLAAGAACAATQAFKLCGVALGNAYKLPGADILFTPSTERTAATDPGGRR